MHEDHNIRDRLSVQFVLEHVKNIKITLSKTKRPYSAVEISNST